MRPIINRLVETGECLNAPSFTNIKFITMSKNKIQDDLDFINNAFSGKKPSVINWNKINNMSNQEIKALHKILK